jgi:Family of unknown function (DUF6121)
VSTQGTSHRPAYNRYFVAVLATAMYLALVVATFGFTSLILDRDAVPEKDAGPLLGPSMVAVACIVVFVAVARMPARPTPWLRAVAAAASTFLAMLVTGAISFTLTRIGFAWLLPYLVSYSIGPFVMAASILAALTVLGSWVLFRRTI